MVPGHAVLQFDGSSMDTSFNSSTAVGLDSDYEAAMQSVRRAIEDFRGCSPEERA